MGIRPHAVNALPANLGGEHRPEPAPLKPHRLVANVDPALGQQVLNVPERQRIFDVHHHDEADYVRRAVEIMERARRRRSGFAVHPRWLPLLCTPCHIRLTMPFPDMFTLGNTSPSHGSLHLVAKTVESQDTGIAQLLSDQALNPDSFWMG